MMLVKLSFSFLITIALLAAAASHAQDVTRAQAARLLASDDAQERRGGASRLGEIGTMPDVPLLLRELHDPDQDARDEAQQAIWRIWSRSGNPEVDKLYETGVQQMGAGDLDDAIATFTRIIKMKPDFAEGWNKRATLYFLAGDMHKSLADCDEVMKRNPYHFGALSGYGMIYMQLDQPATALTYFERALAVNPNLESTRQTIELLKTLLIQRRKDTI